jgi:membrane protein DedA with SNARE-associated domain
MRSLISIPAGLRRMPLVPFTLYTLLGSLVWNIALIGAGYLLGERWQQVEEPMELFQKLVLLVLGVAVAWFVWRRIVRPRLRRAEI